MQDMLHGFLDDIVAHPHDPFLWLILADWLEDRFGAGHDGVGVCP